MSRIGRLAAMAAVVALVSLPASAQELKIDIKTEPSLLGLKFHTLNPNIQVVQHFFEARAAA